MSGLQSARGVTVRAQRAGTRAEDHAALEALAGGQSVVQRCRACGSTDHGQPRVEQGFVSLSRAAGTLVTAFAAQPVGVDVASIAAVSAHPLDAWTPAEHQLLADAAEADGRVLRAILWAAKEAVVKLDGRGLVIDPRQIEVAPTLDEARWTGPDDLPQAAALELESLPGGLVLVIATADPSALRAPAQSSAGTAA